MTSTGRRRSGDPDAGVPELPLPDGLEHLALDGADEDLVLLHWPVRRSVALPAGLTEAERAVAALAARGLSYEAIARARRRSVGTVGKQLSRVYQKLGVGSRAELVARLSDVGEPAA